MLDNFGINIFLIAQIGFVGILRTFGVNKFLSWITSIIIQTLLLYLSAMLNILAFGLSGIPILGCLLFVLRIVFIIIRFKPVPFEGIHYFDVWMIFIGLLLGKVLLSSNLIHYDNYSHWALIIKFLTYQGHLPTAHDTLITFTSYPPATALFVTEFVKWVGFSNGAMLVGQFMIIWASLYALFAVIPDRTRALNEFLLCLAFSLINVFNIAIRMNNLLVDFVLPVVTAAGLAGIYAHRTRPKLQCIITLLFASELFLVKNSGTIYVVVLGVFLIYSLLKEMQGPWKRKVSVSAGLTALTLSLSYLPFYWWNQHVQQAFTAVSKHQISAQSYQKQLSHEGSMVIARIGHKFLNQILNLNSLSTKGVILINLILLISWVIIRLLLYKKSFLLMVLLAIDFSFIVYYLSVFAMYIVSMPYAEAIKLDGSERYLSSMVILNLLITAMALSISIDRSMYEQRIFKRGLKSFSSIITKNIYQLTSLVLMIFSTIMMFSEINGIQYNNSLGKEQLPVQLQKIAPQTNHYNHKKILIVDPHPIDVDNYYAGYVGRYYFFSDQVIGQENFMMSNRQFKQTIQSYQYIVIPECHRTFSTMLKKSYHQNYKTGIYKVKNRGITPISKI